MSNSSNEPKPFDFVNAINSSKKHLMRGTSNDELAEKIYNPYLTNKSLSYFPDTIELANWMNLNHHLDHVLQFEFYLNSVRKRKRYSKWHKKDVSADLDAVSEYFGYSLSKAEDALKVLTDEQVQTIKEIISTVKQ
mgnify:CR=1 FL=1